MSVYRTLPQEPNPRAFFGHRRLAILQLVLGVVLLLVPVVMIALWMRGTGTLFGQIFYLPLLGAGLLSTGRWGSLELHRMLRTLVVTRTVLGMPRRRTVPADAVAGVRVIESRTARRGAGFELQLLLDTGAAISLRSASTSQPLLKDRATLGDFLLEHGLLRDAAPAREQVRVAAPPPAAPTRRPQPAEATVEAEAAEPSEGKRARTH